MSQATRAGTLRRRSVWTLGLLLVLAGVGSAALFQTTLEDFHVAGTQVGDVSPLAYYDSTDCRGCHGDYDPVREPARNWRGSLMANSARDPFFFAALTSANQDVANVGTFCLRCHLPMSVATGNVLDASGNTLDLLDRDGVTCHFCHSLVDPNYQPGNPHQDVPILNALLDRPQLFGNGMFVLDPLGRRRGPLDQPVTPHEFLESPFHEESELCGTCHDVGNVITTRQPDGTYAYNALDQRADSADPLLQFPLDRTYTEWRLSAYATQGVDTGGRFGGETTGPLGTCQECHMPTTTGQLCVFGPERADIPIHQFAGAAASVLALIGEQERDNPDVDGADLAQGQRSSISMLRRAASLGVRQSNGVVRVRVINESGHKLPTGHADGRRMWITVRFYDAYGTLLSEYGRYDAASATLGARSTRVYEQQVGLSAAAAALTGLPPGRTGHMVLADTIVKDNRIPPRGFSNAEFSAAGAPAVGQAYADGQFWDDTWFTAPPDSASVEVDVNYQSLTRQSVEELRDDNHTDARGQHLFDLWNATGKCAPVRMVRAALVLTPFLYGDVDGDCIVGPADLALFLASLGRRWDEPGFEPRADLDGDHVIGARDGVLLQNRLGAHCP